MQDIEETEFERAIRKIKEEQMVGTLPESSIVEGEALEISENDLPESSDVEGEAIEFSEDDENETSIIECIATTKEKQHKKEKDISIIAKPVKSQPKKPSAAETFEFIQRAFHEEYQLDIVIKTLNKLHKEVRGSEREFYTDDELSDFAYTYIEKGYLFEFTKTSDIIKYFMEYFKNKKPCKRCSICGRFMRYGWKSSSSSNIYCGESCMTSDIYYYFRYDPRERYRYYAPYYVDFFDKDYRD